MIAENCVYFNLDMIKISLKRKLTEGERGKRNSGFQVGIHNLLNRFPWENTSQSIIFTRDLSGPTMQRCILIKGFP